MANIDFNCVPKAKPTEIKTSSKITHVRLDFYDCF